KLNEWNRKIDDPTENEIKKQFLKANEMNIELPIVSQNHPDDMYTSKIINTSEIIQTFERLKISQNIGSFEIPY
ncbi:14539_t:CDS:1, partial [Gigaspora rosea]